MSKTLWVASCLHVGANEHEEDELKRYIKTAQAGKWDVALIGDLVDMGMCFGTKNINSVFENSLNPQEQIDKCIELLNPIKNQIVAITKGNHDDRAYKVTGIKVAKIIADQLDVPYYESQKLLKWNDFNIFLAHGQSSSKFGDFDKVIKTYDDLDAIVLGHTHEWLYYAVRKYRTSNKSNHNLIHCARAGSFLGYAEYAKQALYPPQPVGSPILRAHEEGLEIKYGLASI